MCGSEQECVGVSADRRGNKCENQQENDKTRYLYGVEVYKM